MRRTAAGLLVLGILGVLGPLLPLLLWSVSGHWRYPALLPQQASSRGLRLLADPTSGVGAGLLTSLLIGAAVAACALAVGVPAGRALGAHTFAGKRLVQLVLLAPALVPTLAALLGTHVVFLRLGLADTVQGVVLAQLVPAVPYVTFVLAAAFERFDRGYEDQARVLGAGPFATTLLVTLPALRPALTVAAVLAFLLSWSDYVLALLIGGGTVQTLPLLLFAYARGADLTEATAVAVLLVVPPLLGLTVLARAVLPEASAHPTPGGP